jgi:hypothetical protein
MGIKELRNFTPYQDIMLQYAKECKINMKIKFICMIDYLVNREIEFISFPIHDGSVHQDNQHVLDFCLQLCDRIRRGQVVLVHCW